MRKIILVFLVFINIYAHPHFFIDSSLEIKKDYIKHIWKFDRLNSRILMFEFDKNRDKIVDIDEKNDFINIHFKTLQKDNYNLFIDIDGVEHKIIPQNIDLKFKNRQIELSFLTNVSIKNESTICTMDQTIYMAYKLINIDTKYKIKVEKSEYDYCIGVIK